jgi:hypothetical protein
VSNFKVAEPILNSPFVEPQLHWFIQSGKSSEKRAGWRAPAEGMKVIDDRGNELLVVKKLEGGK